MPWIWLGLIGLGAGTFGTLLGIGGGIILVPVLLFLYPEKSPEAITAITLSAVLANAVSGSIAYGRLHRINYRAALLFALTGIPGAILGANLSAWMEQRLFQIIFAAILLVMACYLILRPHPQQRQASRSGGLSPEPVGHTHSSYPFNLPLGMGIFFVTGIVSSSMGIGGGIIHVPVMTAVLSFPVHTSTATSHLIIALTSLAGVGVHIASGVAGANLGLIIPLALGCVVGAQFGAQISQKVSGVLILRLLAVGLVTLGVRLLLTLPT